MRLGIISLGGPSSLLIAQKAKKYFEQVDSLNLKDFEVHLTDKGITVAHSKKDLERYDCLYVRGSYKYSLLQRAITRALHNEVYMPIKPLSFTLAHNKFLTLLELQKNGLPIPKTYYAETTRLAIKILEEEVSYPVILKLQEGTQGKGVLIADSLPSAKTILDILEKFNKPYIIQEFVETKDMSDIRIIVVGDEVLASYRRIACENEIRSNVHSGGRREECILSENEKEVAINSAKAIGAMICGVDLLNSEIPSVTEVNLSPGISGVEEFLKVDISDKISQFLYSRTLKFKKRKKERANKKLKKMNSLKDN